MRFMVPSQAAKRDGLAARENGFCISNKRGMGNGRRALQKRIVLPTESEILMHNFVIETVAEGKNEVRISIGDNEQRNYLTFRKLGVPWGKNKYGPSDYSFERMRQTDVLWLSARSIAIAFEVENSQLSLAKLTD